MKTILSWLGDPYLHLIAIGTVVVAIGAAGASHGSSGPGEVCEVCDQVHDGSVACPAVAAEPRAVAPVR